MNIITFGARRVLIIARQCERDLRLLKQQSRRRRRRGSLRPAQLLSLFICYYYRGFTRAVIIIAGDR